MSTLTISPTIRRRFILGKQGLYPGRRWRSVLEAARAGAVIQIDPLNVVARSHDISLYGRVQGYRPALLDAALYTERTLFDHGGTIVVHPMEELPYWRVTMARKGAARRWREILETYHEAVDEVMAAVRERGPLSSRDFAAGQGKQWSSGYRTTKLYGQVLYALWLSGELLTHSRRGNERLYDLRERIAPPQYQHVVSPDEADAFFTRKILEEYNMLTAKSLRLALYGTIERQVTPAEVSARIDALLAEGKIAPIIVEDDPKTQRYILSEDVPLLETLLAGKIPAAWQPLDSTTNDAMVFLAPLEIVSARGRAKVLFDFNYIWEVYKPVEKRQWGYYTLPILYGDKLVGRFDSRVDRAEGVLRILGFWLESDVSPDDAFAAALGQGFRQFNQFVGARTVDVGVMPPSLAQAVEQAIML